MPSSYTPSVVNDGQSGKTRSNSSSSTLDYNLSRSDSLNSQRMIDRFFRKTMKDGKSKGKTSGGAFASLKGAFVKQVKMDDLSRDDIIIAVMGPSGSGKSTFINTIAGVEIGVEHTVTPCTLEVTGVRCSFPELAYGDLVFVDTPGFDGTNTSHVDVLKMVADWLKTIYGKDTLLSGVLYFHRITDDRTDSTPGPLKDLRRFEKLCGKNSFQNAILATTMWDGIGEKEGEAREQQLKSNYWRPMLERGSTTSRFMRTREWAFALVDPFIEVANKRISVLLQQEMVDMSRDLPATSAGHELYSKMEFFVRQRQDLLDRIRNEMKRAEGDNMALEPLQEEHEKLRISLEATANKMRALKLPLSKRLLQMADKFHKAKPNKDVSSPEHVIIAVETRAGPESYTSKTSPTRTAMPEVAQGGLVPAYTSGSDISSNLSKDVPSPDDIVIVVIGPSGSGKSTFINTIMGLETSVGHGLESCTREVRGFTRSFPELACGNLVFVDTPGFEIAKTSDVDILLKMIARWFKSTYAKDIVLAGLLYFHRITDNRMGGTPLKNLHVFEELCGKNTLQNIILVTTMWDDVEEEEGEVREQQLKSKYWRPILERNGTTRRFMRTRESAFDLVYPFIDAANKRILVLLQQEMVDMNRQLPATSVGHELYSKIESLVRQRQDLLDRIRNEMKRAEGDNMALEPLQEEHEKLRISLEATVNKMRQLDLPLGKRLVKMTEKTLDNKFMSKFFNFILSNPSKDDRITASVMGPTDSGKSIFKNITTGLEIGVEPNPKSCTSEISTVGPATSEVAYGRLSNPSMDDPFPDDIIIAIIGPAGSGKSTFINTITGLETGVGPNSESFTSKISTSRCSFPELAYGDLVFLDTPGLGFDTENMSSQGDVPKMVTDWLKKTYRKDTSLSGVLYFHRITDNPIDTIPGPLQNLYELAKEPCGKDAFQNVILVTTMWDEVDQEVGGAREKELRSKYLGPMLKCGSTTSRFLLTRESAFALIDPFIEAANKRFSDLLQQETVDMRGKFPATSVGHELYSKMELLMMQRQELLDRVRREIKCANGDRVDLKPLQQEHEKLRINLEATINEMQELKLPLGKCLATMTEKFLGPSGRPQIA